MKKDINQFYVDSKNEWNSVFGKAAQSARFSNMVAIISLVIAAIAVLGCIILAKKTQYIPFVVETDKTAKPLQVYQLKELSKPNEAVTRSLLASFIIDLRTVFTDKQALHNNITKTFVFLQKNTQAYNLIVRTFESENPFAATAPVKVTIKNIFPISKNSWRIEWNENTLDIDGTDGIARPMTAILKIGYQKSIDERSILINPIGLIVEEIQMSKEFK